MSTVEQHIVLQHRNLNLNLKVDLSKMGQSVPVNRQAVQYYYN